MALRVVPASLASGSPIDSLSDDVLSLIFHLCIKPVSYHEIGQNDSIRTDRHPWVLSQVSRSWRGLALSSPLLWSDIKIDMEKYVPFRHRASHLAFLLNLSLQRSRDVELDVEIRDVCRHGEYEHQRYNLIRNYLAPLFSTTSRWHHLRIFTYPDVLRMLSGDSFASLRSIRLCLLCNTDPEIYLNLFRHAPKLARLQWDSSIPGGRWYDIHFPGAIQKITLPWRGIRHFHTPLDGLVNLSQMPYLEELHISTGSSLTDMHLHSSPLALPHLTLPLLHTISSDAGLGCVLREASQRIVAPALRTLTLHIRYYACLEPYLPDFHDIDKVVNLSVEFMAGGYGMNVDNEVVSFLSCARSVETLSIDCNCVAIPAMMRAIGRGQVLSKLTTLCVYITLLCEDEGDIVSMVERRCKDGNVTSIDSERRENIEEMDCAL